MRKIQKKKERERVNVCETGKEKEKYKHWEKSERYTNVV